MADFSDKVLTIMKSKFGPAANDISNDIFADIGISADALGPQTIQAFARQAENKARSFMSEKDAAALYGELMAL